MWTYSQSTGKLSHDGVAVAIGYSGASGSINNGSLQAVRNVGPIPRGKWRIGPDVSHIPAYSHLGAPCFCLTPWPLTVTFGRDGFLIHADRADAATNPHKASEGCIILPGFARQMIGAAKDRDLEVVE